MIGRSHQREKDNNHCGQQTNKCKHNTCDSTFSTTSWKHLQIETVLIVHLKNITFILWQYCNECAAVLLPVIGGGSVVRGCDSKGFTGDVLPRWAESNSDVPVLKSTAALLLLLGFFSWGSCWSQPIPLQPCLQWRDPVGVRVGSVFLCFTIMLHYECSNKTQQNL